MEVKLTEPALQDLRCINSFISSYNPETARKILGYIFEQIEDKITKNPNIGRNGKVLRTKEFILSKYPYMIVYQVKDNHLIVLRILHTARKWPVS